MECFQQPSPPDSLACMLQLLELVVRPAAAGASAGSLLCNAAPSLIRLCSSSQLWCILACLSPSCTPRWEGALPPQCIRLAQLLCDALFRQSQQQLDPRGAAVVVALHLQVLAGGVNITAEAPAKDSDGQLQLLLQDGERWRR